MEAYDNKNLFPLPLECREEVAFEGSETEAKNYLSALLGSYHDDGEQPFCFRIREMEADGANTREWLYYGDELCADSESATEHSCHPRFKEQDIVHVVCDDYLTAGIVVSHSPKEDAYKLLIDKGDGMLSAAQIPSSLILPIRWEYHLPRSLMGFLRQHFRALANK